MKTLLTVILLVSLAACGEGATVAVASDTAERAPIQTTEREPVQAVEAPREPIVAPVRVEPRAEAPVVEPEPILQVGCDLTTYNPCATSAPITQTQVTCDPWSYIPCGSFPPPGPGYELCDLTSYNPCATPTWVYKQPVEVVVPREPVMLCPESQRCEPIPAQSRLVETTR